MRKEVGIYISVGVLVFVGLFIAYLLNVGLTGFVVFQQSTQTDFDQGTYSSTLYNGSDVVLDLGTNATGGTYTSKVFDAGSSATWNNITFVGASPSGTSTSFQVTTCSSLDCSDANFVTPSDLNNLNLTSQYFQYKVSFSGLSSTDNVTNITTITSPSLTSVTVDSSPISAPLVTSASISQPAGEKTSISGIPITFTATGSSDIACSYSVHDASDDAEIQANTTIIGCNSTTFDLGAGEGSYTLYLYVSGSSGFVQKTSSFSINIGTPSDEEEAGEEEIETTIQVPVVPQAPQAPPAPALQLTAGDIAALTINPGASSTITWTLTNTGTNPLSACILKAQGDLASWIAAPEDSQNLNPGEAKNFVFTVSVPESLTDGANTLSVSVECAETAAGKDFTVNVVNEKIGFEIVGVARNSDSNVRVTYSLTELSGVDQNVSLAFLILDSASQQFGNASENRTISANDSNQYRINIPINGSLIGENLTNFTLSAAYSSPIYSDSVAEPIQLGPVSGGLLGGFAIFEGLGTGGSIVVIVVVLALAVLLFVVVRMRKSGKNLMDVLGNSEK